MVRFFLPSLPMVPSTSLGTPHVLGKTPQFEVKTQRDRKYNVLNAH